MQQEAKQLQQKLQHEVNVTREKIKQAKSNLSEAAVQELKQLQLQFQQVLSILTASVNDIVDVNVGIGSVMIEYVEKNSNGKSLMFLNNARINVMFTLYLFFIFVQ